MKTQNKMLTIAIIIGSTAAVAIALSSRGLDNAKSNVAIARESPPSKSVQQQMGKQPEKAESRLNPTDQMTIAITGALRGQLDNCKCPGKKYQSLTRLATMVRRTASPTTLLVDTGNVLESGATYNAARFQYLLRAYQSLGYNAIALGTEEANLEISQLKEVVGSFEPLFVATNLQGFRIPRYRKVRVGERMVAIVSVADRMVQGAAALMPPMEALGAIMPQLAQESDFIILIGSLQQPLIEKITKAFPKIKLLITTDDKPQAHSRPTVRSKETTIVFSTGNVRLKLLQLSLRMEKGSDRIAGLNYTITTPDAQTPEDAEVSLIVEQYKKHEQRRVQALERHSKIGN